jgi:hypothetical protein
MRKAPSVKIRKMMRTAVEAECVCGDAEWAYLGEPLVPLKGFPGVVWERSRRKKQPKYGGI